MRKHLTAAFAGSIAAATLGIPSATSMEPAPIAQDALGPPNVVLFLIDDATVEDMAYMPNVQALLVDQAARRRVLFTVEHVDAGG